MEALNIKKITLLIILLIINQNCMNIDNKKTKNEYNNFVNSNLNIKQIDSLKTEGYIFTKKIDFFTLEPKEVFTPTTEKIFFAYKKDGNIKIINFEYGKISLKREIKKYVLIFYKENRFIDSSDGGELQFLTYYYSKDKIIITEVTENIFESNKKNKYISGIYIIDKNKYKKYYYRYDNDFHLETDITLDEKQLLNIDEIALTLFYNKDNVEFIENDFKMLIEDSYVWDINKDN